MLEQIFYTELKSSLKSPAFWLMLGVLAFISFQDSANIEQGRRIINDFGLAHHNAPLFIARDFALLSLMTVLLTIVLTGRVVTKDFERNAHAFYFTSPLTKGDYLFGRFLSGFTATMLAFTGVILGFMAASVVRDSHAFGTHSLAAYTFGWLGIALPNILFMSSLFFSVATLTRNMVVAYLSGVGFLLLFGIGSNLVSTLENETFQTLIDPTGLSFLSNQTSNWTVADINTRHIPLTNLFLLNRFTFISLAGMVFFLTWKRFKLHEHVEIKSNREIKSDKVDLSKPLTISVPTLILDQSMIMQWRAILHQAWREAWRVVKHPAFLILTFISIQTIYGNFTNNVGPNGSNIYPLTSWFIRFVTTAYGFVIPITIFFGGMFVWQDRDRGTAAFYDVLPMPVWTKFVSRLLMLLIVYISYVVSIFLCGIFCQVVLFGYTDVELPLYAKSLLGIELINYLHVAIIVLFINALVSNKYMGFFMSALFYAADIVIFQMLEVDNNLLHYGSLPSYIYSNLSGFGAYAENLIWYRIYWLFPAGLLALFTVLLWQSGETFSLKERIKVARQRLTHRIRFAIATCTVLTIVVGGYIYYNENVRVLNISEEEQHEMNAEYERKYQRLKYAPTPTIDDVYLEVDLHPNKSAVDMKGYYKLVNHTHVPITEVLVSFITPFERQTTSFEIEGATMADADATKGTYVYRFKQPLVAGDSVKLLFDYRLTASPFNHGNTKNLLVAQGNLINNYTGSIFFPDVGYNITNEIPDSVTRAQYGLPHRPMLYAATDSLHASQSFRSFINYEAIISAPSDRSVISNGTLYNTWEKDERTFYHYRSEVPMNNAIAISSGVFEVKKVKSGNKLLEVYYDAKHPYNIDRMLNGMQKALTYCEANFSPYPYESIRIAEVNRAAYPGSGTATSLPTLFAWQEYGGFISNVEGEGNMDVVFNTTTHELAHQWWGNMILPAAVEGTGVMTESMAQWVRIMCLENEYGEERVKDFLELEMDNYLRSRRRDLSGERSLIRSINQSYLLYNKGTLVMYTMKEYLGEDSVNTALRRLAEKFAMNQNHFVTVLDLVSELRKVTPGHLQYLISDLFEKITLYELSVKNAVIASNQDAYRVKVTVDAKKLYADRIGTETEAPMDDFIPIIIQNKDGKIIYFEMMRLKSGTHEYELSVSEMPSEVVLDPKGFIIEREKADNTFTIVINP